MNCLFFLLNPPKEVPTLKEAWKSVIKMSLIIGILIAGSLFKETILKGI